MEAVKSLALEQKKIEEAIVQFLSSCKKDLQLSKNANYVARRLRNLEDFWYIARRNQKQIMKFELEFKPTQHLYVVRNYFEQISEKYEETKEYLKKCLKTKEVATAKKEALLQGFAYMIQNTTLELEENKSATWYQLLEKELDKQWNLIEEQHIDILTLGSTPPGHDYMIKHQEIRKTRREIKEKILNKIKKVQVGSSDTYLKTQVTLPDEYKAPIYGNNPEDKEYTVPEYKLPEYNEYTVPEYEEYKLPEYKEYTVPEFMMPECKEYKVPEYKEPEYKEPKVPEYKMPKDKEPKVPKYKMPKYKKPKYKAADKPPITYSIPSYDYTASDKNVKEYVLDKTIMEKEESPKKKMEETAINTKNKQNTLTAKRTNTVPVKASYLKATINLNLNNTLLSPPEQIEEEPIFKISDDIGHLKYEEEKIQKHLEEALWRKVKRHSLTVNGSTTIIMVAALFALQAILIYVYRRHQHKKKSNTTSKEKMVELQPLRSEQPLNNPDPLETRENV